MPHNRRRNNDSQCNSQTKSTNLTPKWSECQAYFHLIYSNDHQLNHWPTLSNAMRPKFEYIHLNGCASKCQKETDFEWKCLKWINYLLSFQDDISFSIDPFHMDQEKKNISNEFLQVFIVCALFLWVFGFLYCIQYVENHIVNSFILTGWHHGSLAAFEMWPAGGHNKWQHINH